MGKPSGRDREALKGLEGGRVGLELAPTWL